MQETNRKHLIMILIPIIVLSMHDAIAQPPPPFPTNVSDAVPINGLVGLALLVGTYFGVRKLGNMK